MPTSNLLKIYTQEGLIVKFSGKEKFANFDEYEDYVSEDEFILDAEIDQSLKVIIDLIEIES